ncbi:MAG TPA: universal stress protein [Blastocatellia bacterium]|nr:universal stress protein [Blastocatellia bacterium]
MNSGSRKPTGIKPSPSKSNPNSRKAAAHVFKMVEVTTMIKSGSPKEVILDESESWDADLIVLGSHGYGGWRRFLLGSVSHAVATHAHCSVEIVRKKNTRGKNAAR